LVEPDRNRQGPCPFHEKLKRKPANLTIDEFLGGYRPSTPDWIPPTGALTILNIGQRQRVAGASRSNANVCLLDPASRHVAPDEERQRDDGENDQNCDQHESPFFEMD
jgi:hypothetical protein